MTQKKEEKQEVKKYNFGEKKAEYSAKQGKAIEVIISSKYIYARNKVIEMLESEQYKEVLDVSDFWILMNETKQGKMNYSGLIISHNGCLKINDTLPAEKKFKPECLTIDKDGFKNSLVYSYNCPEQGICEVGEVSDKNCKNDYPYAMALKRCMDRVILKNSKLAYAGVYSDSEAEEFKAPDEELPKKEAKQPKKEVTVTKNATEHQINYMALLKNALTDRGIDLVDYCKTHKVNSKTTQEEAKKLLEELEGEAK